MIELIEQCNSWCENRHDYAREWKSRTGKKVSGTFCTYVPEEILVAVPSGAKKILRGV